MDENLLNTKSLEKPDNDLENVIGSRTVQDRLNLYAKNQSESLQHASVDEIALWLIDHTDTPPELEDVYFPWLRYHGEISAIALVIKATVKGDMIDKFRMASAKTIGAYSRSWTPDTYDDDLFTDLIHISIDLRANQAIDPLVDIIDSRRADILDEESSDDVYSHTLGTLYCIAQDDKKANGKDSGRVLEAFNRWYNDESFLQKNPHYAAILLNELSGLDPSSYAKYFLPLSKYLKTAS